MKKIFIGSSSEALGKAYHIQSILKGLGADTTCWADDGAFTLSHNTIDELIRSARTYDAGVFIFDKDDELVSSKDGNTEYIPRDNVIAEAGMFVSILGKEPVVLCIVPGVREISDFKGITQLFYDPNNMERLQNKLKIWLEGVKEGIHIQNKNNVLMLPRQKIHNLYSLDDRLHISDNKYKKIRSIKIMNFASNILINPEFGEIGHLLDGLSLSDAIEKIMRETDANVELILAKPTRYNLNDLETKIANQKAGSSAGALYSALWTLYKNLSNKDTIYYQRKFLPPHLFSFYVMKTSIPFGIFNVEFLGEYRNLNHVKVDLYSAALDNEDSRRSFVVWQASDPDNYDFFVKNFDNIKRDPRLCEEPTLEMLKEWAEVWDNVK